MIGLLKTPTLYYCYIAFYYDEFSPFTLFDECGHWLLSEKVKVKLKSLCVTL